jgi:acetate kinase
MRGHGHMGHSTPNPDAPRAERSVLALNSGSSTIKFGLFTFDAEPRALCRGTADASSRDTAVEQLMERLASDIADYPVAAVGHRIVHGGPDYSEPQPVTPTLLASLRDLVRFAPNHLPDEIDLIESVHRLCPETPQIVCFDTAFHAGLPDVSRRLAVPARYAAEGVRRYGFHGLSYTFLLDELGRRIGPAADSKKIVLAHLGNGSSLAAVRSGRSIDTSMGFTPIGGVVMSTRSGDLDPGVVTYIARTTGFDADEVEHELSHRSGLAALSGGTADMRELLAREADDERCRMAVAIYCYAVRKQIGAFAAALGGIDVLVFSGGIGERAGVVRSRICEDLRFLGIEVDDQRNAAGGPLISTATGRVAVHVIPTDEEVVIARSAYHLLQKAL